MFLFLLLLFFLIVEKEIEVLLHEGYNYRKDGNGNLEPELSNGGEGIGLHGRKHIGNDDRCKGNSHSPSPLQARANIP